MRADQQWHAGEVLAWTEADGPRRPPAGPGRISSALIAGGMGVAITAVVLTDSLCEVHAMWVDGLATLALFGSIAAVTCAVRGSTASMVLTAISAGAGVAIGAIDAIHSPVRGAVVATFFGIAFVAAIFGFRRSLRLLRWDHELRGQLEPAPAAHAAGAGAVAAPDTVSVPETGAEPAIALDNQRA